MRRRSARSTQLIEAVRGVRNIRAELGIPPNATVSIHVAADGRADLVAAPRGRTSRRSPRSATSSVLGAGERPTGEPSAVVDGVGEMFVPLRGVVDPADVRKRLERDLGKVEKELAGVAAKLGRPDFVDKAPAEIVDKERQRAATLHERVTTLRRHLEALREGA